MLVNLYAKYKKKTLDLLEGMFSFVVFDTKENNCFLARDRFGIKPLYFKKFKNKIVISSEIKPLLAYETSIKFNNQKLLRIFFKRIYGSWKRNFFKNIYSLEQGSFLETNLDKYNLKNSGI